MTQGVVLFAHGSREPRWAKPFEQIKNAVASRHPGLPLALAYLERMDPDLSAAVATLVAAGATDIAIVPLFLGQGGHLAHDLPRMVHAVTGEHQGVVLRLAGAAGEDPEVLDALARFCERQIEA